MLCAQQSYAKQVPAACMADTLIIHTGQGVPTPWRLALLVSMGVGRCNPRPTTFVLWLRPASLSQGTSLEPSCSSWAADRLLEPPAMQGAASSDVHTIMPVPGRPGGARHGKLP